MSKTALDSEPSTGVILVCVQNKYNKILTHDKFFKCFSPYGTIQKILIFERQAIWKIFIEYDSVDSAKLAQQDLNNSHFYDDPTLKITIHSSQLETINFQENNPAGVDYTILRQKINEKQKKITLAGSPLSQGNPSNESRIINDSRQHAITPSPYSYDQMIMHYQSHNDSSDQTQFSQQFNNKNLFIMQNSMNLEFMRQQLNFQQQLQQNLENIQNSSMMLQQLSFEQQSLAFKQDLQSPSTKSLLQKHFDMLKQLSDHHQFAQNIISQYHQFLLNSSFYRQQMDIQQPQKQSGQIEFLKSIDEPQPSLNTKPIFPQSQEHTPKQPFQKNSKTNTPSLNNTRQSETPSGKPRFINSKRHNQNNGELYEDVNKDTEIGEYVNPLFLKVTRKCKVLYARWFDKKIVTLRMLYNMFSLYGNVEKMIYFKEKSGCLVQYFSIENAETAKECLTDVVFYGQVLKIFYSNYEEIVLKQIYQGEQQFNQDPSNNEEYFLGHEDTFRFKNTRNNIAPAPCDTLLISDLNDELVEANNILTHFQRFGNPTNHKFITDSENQHQCIIKFQSTEIALKYLVHMHNSTLNKKQISITFSGERL